MNAPTRTTTLADMRSLAPEAPQRYTVALTDSQGFELAQRAAKLLAASQLVPKEYQGNLPNCVIALNMAQRVGADPLMIMQNLVIVHGRPTWSSQFLIATVNTCGRFSALRYEFFGQSGTDGWGCRAWAVEKATGEKLVGTDITIAIAKKEGWYGKNGSKWQSIPQQMLMYRAGSWWCRAYAPELSMGLQTADEAADIIELNPDGTVASVTTETLRSASREVRVADMAQPEQAATTAAATAVEQETGEIPNTATDADAPAQQPAQQQWQPTPEKLEEISARDITEANGQPSTPSRGRRERAAADGIE
jgi:hypothetical protein